MAGKFDYLLHSAKHSQEPPKLAPDYPKCVDGCAYRWWESDILRCVRCGYLKQSDRC